MAQDSTGVGEAAAVPERSGADVAEAVDTAAAGTPSGGVQAPPQETKPSTAPVEQVQGDPAMTQGQVVEGPGTAATTTGPDPARTGGAGAQSVLGARVSDRVAAGEPAPGGAAATDGA